MNGAFKLHNRNNSINMWSLKKVQRGWCLSLGREERKYKANISVKMFLNGK
jgi:hypothetical protein